MLNPARQAIRMASAGLLLLLVSMVSSVLLAANAVLPAPVAVAVTVPVAAWFVGLWAVIPLAVRGPLRAPPVDTPSRRGR